MGFSPWASDRIQLGGGLCQVNSDGSVTITPAAAKNTTLASGQLLLPDGSASAPSVGWSAEANSGWYRVGGGYLGLAITGNLVASFLKNGANTQLNIERGSLVLTVGGNNALFLDGNNVGIIQNDCLITRDAANTLAQRNGTNNQTFRLYGTYTDSSNFERLNINYYSGNATYYVSTEKGGTGSSRSLVCYGQQTQGNGNGLSPGTSGTGIYLGDKNSNANIFLGGCPDYTSGINAGTFTIHGASSILDGQDIYLVGGSGSVGSSQADKHGGTVTISTGSLTGTGGATPPSITFKTTPIGTTGSTVQNPATRWQITSAGDLIAGSAGDVGISRPAAKVLTLTDGASGKGWVQNSAGEAALASNATNATATMAATNLSLNVIAGRTYRIEGMLQISDSTAADGVQIDFNGGTATATTFWVAAQAIGSVTAGTVTSTTLAGAINYTVVTGTDYVFVEGYLKVNAGGTLILRFAQNSHTTGTATLGAGSWIGLHDTINL